MEKTTKRQDYTAIINVLTEVNADPALIERMKKEIASLDKKNAKRKEELTDTQKENLEFKDKVVEYLTEETDSKSNSQIAKYLGISTQRLTNILITLVNEEKLKVETIKRTNYYSVV